LAQEPSRAVGHSNRYRKPRRMWRVPGSGAASAVAVVLTQRALGMVIGLPAARLPPALDQGEAEACAQPMPRSSHTSLLDPEPKIEDAPTPGQRVRMPPSGGMEYQLFLPAAWSATGAATYPVVVFLHGHGDGKFTVMHSQSLPRLLSPDQSTSFDGRKCWCLESRYARVTANREAPPGSPEAFLGETEDLFSPLADCDFAETFPAIVVMPQGWLPGQMSGWTEPRRDKVEEITRSVLRKYRGDPARVVLTGQSEGGAGAWRFAASRPGLWSAVSVICAAAPPSVAQELEGLPVWVVGSKQDGLHGNDAVVAALKERQKGSTRYTRYIDSPAPPDPEFRDMTGHASYDLIYRDPRLWTWAFKQHSLAAGKEWGV